jgi:hypothetical protein
MCWNADVSLNTFVFSLFVLGMIYYNNNYTRYKIKEFNNKLFYVFFLIIISVQLSEYFLWTHYNNKSINKLFTIIVNLLIFAEPIASISLLNKKKNMRKWLMIGYLAIFTPVVINHFLTNKNITDIMPNGHLNWNNFTVSNTTLAILWTIFFLLPLFLAGHKVLSFFGLSTFLIITYNYYKTSTLSSMWCWTVNTLMLIYAAYLLMYLPTTT